MRTHYTKYKNVCGGGGVYEKGGVLRIYSTTDGIKPRRVPIFMKLVLENVASNLVVDSVCHRMRQWLQRKTRETTKRPSGILMTTGGD